MAVVVVVAAAVYLCTNFETELSHWWGHTLPACLDTYRVSMCTTQHAALASLRVQHTNPHTLNKEHIRSVPYAWVLRRYWEDARRQESGSVVLCWFGGLDSIQILTSLDNITPSASHWTYLPMCHTPRSTSVHVITLLLGPKYPCPPVTANMVGGLKQVSNHRPVSVATVISLVPSQLVFIACVTWLCKWVFFFFSPTHHSQGVKG